MGYRLPQIRELDPSVARIQPQMQVMQGTPYWQQMMQRDQQNAERQNQMTLQRGQYEAQKAAADIAGDNAWIGGLDRAVSSVLPAAQAVHGMGMENKKLLETQKTGEVNRAATMEATLGQRFKNEMDAQFGQRERQAGLDMTGAQTKGIGITNEQGQLALQKAQREEQFANADASQAGFPEAKPGETVANYAMRMEQEGKIANSKLVQSQAKKMGIEADNITRRLKLEEDQLLAQTAAQKAQTAQGWANINLARQQDARLAESQNFAMKQARITEASKNLDQFIAGFASKLYGNVTPEQEKALIENEAKNLVASFGGNPQDVASFLAGAVTRHKSNQTAAKAAENVILMQSPDTRLIIEQNQKQQQKLTTASELLANLKASAEGFKTGAGKVINSDEAKFRANQIRTALKNAARQVPEFEPFVKQFEDLNANVLENPLQAARNLFGPSPQAQVDSLIKSISEYVLNDVKAGGPIHPTMMPAIQTLTSSLQTSGNDLIDLMSKANIPKITQPIPNPNIPQQTNYGVGGRR